MARIPRDPTFDSTLALFREGYRFGLRHALRSGSDAFRTRIGLLPAVIAFGEDAARTFYEPERLTRRWALPITTLALLQDRGSVQVLDGEAHRHRKAMFLSVMGSTSLDELCEYVAREWEARSQQWAEAERVVLLDELHAVLTRAVCVWAGLRLREDELRERTHEFAAMIEGAGSAGPRNWRGLALRRRTESWARELVRDIRAGRREVPEHSPAHVIATHEDLDGEPLEDNIAAVELINLLRPTVAVSRFVVFAALALHEHPDAAAQLHGDDDVERFVQEVRRYYPFFPMVAGRVRQPFEWRGHRFERGDWLFLDLYATNHDPRIWDDPDAFRPDRFRDWDASPFTFVPQGGGLFETGHRCAGEWLTIAVMKTCVRLLQAMDYDVPEQDLRVPLRRMPSAPRSRFVLQDVRPVAHAGATHGV